MPKQIIFSTEAREALLRGVNILADSVKSTIGAKGCNVIIENKFGLPTVTNDGVTIAKAIELEDKYENLGAQLLREAASKTNDVAGDGTTTATVIAQVIVQQGFEALKEGIGQMELKTQIEASRDELLKILRNNRKEVSEKDIVDVATISAADPEIGQLIADVIKEVGKNAPVTVEDSKGLGIEKDIVRGLQFDNGYQSQYMVNETKRMTATFENVAILLTDKKLASVEDIVTILDSLLNAGKRDIVIIAEDFTTDALSVLVMNKLEGKLNAVAVKAPSFGDNRKEILKDIAAVTGATLITEDMGITFEDATLDMLGTAGRVVVTKDRTTISDGVGSDEKVQERVELINGELKDAEGYRKDQLQERLAKLTGGVGVIRVGAHTEAETEELKYRIEDALNATRAAVDEEDGGILPGGGVALLEASDEMYRGTIGSNVMYEAARSPFLAILGNAELGSVEVLKKLEGDSWGIDVKTGKVGSMFEMGIIDPCKVTTSALQNAVSAAVMILTTGVVIAIKPEEDKGA